MILCINPSCHSAQNPDDRLYCQDCGSLLLLNGLYRVTKILSKKGGFANTYEATEQQKTMVLKILKSDNPKALELFSREFKILSDLKCEGIPAVYESFEYYPKYSKQPLHCLVMEKIKGEDLEEYIQNNGKIVATVAIKWLYQLAKILQQLHENNVLHRDIKPSNIILQNDGKLLLIDFGAAKQSAQTNFNATNIGTPGYAPPEIERGIISTRSDIFSLGRTFVYLLTAIEPIVLYNTTTNRLDWRGHTTHISTDVLNLIDRLMDTDPSQRPPDAQAILKEIDRLSLVATSNQVSNNTTTLTPNNNPPLTAVSNTQPPAVTTYLPGNTNSSASVLTAKVPITKNTSRPSTISLPKVRARKAMQWWHWRWRLLCASVLVLAIAAHLSFGNNYSRFSDLKDRGIVPNGTYKFGGSTTWATTRQLNPKIEEEINKYYPEFKLKYTNPNGKCEKYPGSISGICMLLNGGFDFVQSSVPLSALAKNNNAIDIASKQLREIAVGYDAITIVVNPNLEISALTKEQIVAIYTGSITNWNQVDPALGDLPIVPFSRDGESSGTVSSFEELVLGGDKINVPSENIVTSPTAGLQKVQNNKGGIFFGSAKETIVDSCFTKPLKVADKKDRQIAPYKLPLKFYNDCLKDRNQINTEAIQDRTYPLTRKIYVIHKDDGSREGQAGKAYGELLLTLQGQEKLEDAGFVRIDR
jgi:serine/threonine protein kinase